MQHFFQILVAPSEPVNITVISHGATWITVSWLEPTFSGIPEFATFIVEAEPTNTRNSNRLAMIPPHSVTVIVSKDMLYANVTGVFPGEEYRLSARAVSESNGVQACSDSSRPVTVITHTTGMIMLPRLSILVSCIDSVFCVMLLLWADH